MPTGAYTPIQALNLLQAHAKSPSMRAAVEKIRQCAPLELPVLITGETGTGKELAALAMHAPKGTTQPFVALNCGSFEPNLAHSELFGHRKGAFTGASQHRGGAFVRAGQGTLFLDELGELRRELQPSLLRVLETGSFLPLGAERERKSQARILAATHQPLQTLVDAGEFREDLLFRLQVLKIHLPPLRERPEDLPGLLAHFVGRAQRAIGQETRLEPCAIGFAQEQLWPGNLRELWHGVLRAAVHARGLVCASSLQEACDIADHAPLDARVPRFQIAKSSFQDMKQELLAKAVRDAGSMRKAALMLGLPKSTLSDWMRGAAPARWSAPSSAQTSTITLSGRPETKSDRSQSQ